jgi:signal transduction histidine kinase
MIVFSISIVLVFISGRIYAGRALMPILKVIEQVDTISITSLDLRVKAGNGEDEIAKLAHTFNKMLERLEVAFKIQKNFIANASHEIRTPLTAITGQLDVALIKERTQMEYRTIILSVLEDIKNLNSISNRLLLLAQASSETAKVDFKLIRIDDIIWQVRSDLLKIYKDQKINVSIDENLNDEKQLTIVGNDQLIKTAISNLMDNACKYNNDNRMQVNIGVENKFIIVQFTNSGKGIDPQDIDSIFEPFYRGRNATAIKGHGIGLSLAERIIKLHEGTLQVSSILNDKTNFTVRLPIEHI